MKRRPRPNTERCAGGAGPAGAAPGRSRSAGTRAGARPGAPVADLARRFGRTVVGAGNDRRAFPRRLRHLPPARPGRTGRFRPRPRRASEESDLGRASGSGSRHFRDSPFRVALPRFAVAPAGADAEDDDRKKRRKTGPVGGGAPLPAGLLSPRPATPGSGCGRTRSGGDRGRSRPPVPPRTEGLRERPPRPPGASGSLPAESGLGGVQEQDAGARVEECPRWRFPEVVGRRLRDSFPRFAEA